MNRNTQAGRLLTSSCSRCSCRWRPVSYGEKRRPSPRGRELLGAKADPRLRKEAVTGGTEAFAAIAVYRNDVFLDQSEALGRSSLTVLNELGRCVILQITPDQIVPLLKDLPSGRRPGSGRKGSLPGWTRRWSSICSPASGRERKTVT